jgi:hypothetical protein
MTRIIKLGWSRLLGFDQAPRSAGEADAPRANDDRPMPLGAKVGGKRGVKTRISLR